MHALYMVSVVVHIVAACAWIGSMIFFAAVVVPVARDPEYASVRASLVQRIGLRFRALGWVALGTLVVTGITNLSLSMGLAPFASPGIWRTDFGKALSYKLALVVLVVGSTVLHDRLAVRSRSASAMMGRVTLLLSIGVVIFAAMLVRGMP